MTRIGTSTVRTSTTPGGFVTPAPVTGRLKGIGKEEKKDKEEKPQERPRSQLGIHNAPLPTLTRTEKLPWVKGAETDAGEGVSGAAPLWQTRKENKDISKYSEYGLEWSKKNSWEKLYEKYENTFLSLV